MKVLIIFFLCGTSAICSAQPTYSSAKYDISFRYPKTFDLKEGDLSEHPDDGWQLGYLGPIPMEFTAPGGMRVATVKMPANAYPGTDFAMAFLTISVHENLTSKQCEKFPEDVSGSSRSVVRKISGVTFYGLEQGQAAMSHQFEGKYYHGFAHGWCYEIGVGLTTAGYGAVDGVRKISEPTVFGVLDKILQTVAINTPQADSRKKQ
jgi:hypothetical protein